MTGENSQEQPLDQFVTTPLEFFGHGPELYFGYPPEYDDEMARAEEDAAEAAEAFEVARQEMIETGDPSSVEYRQTVPDEWHQANLMNARGPVRDVKNNWYERRMRGRLRDLVNPDEHPEGVAFQARMYRGELDGVTPPAANEMAAYLNAKLAKNGWYGSYSVARAWYNCLPEGHEDKEVAKSYAGFAGNLLVTEYCKLALAYANADMKDDMFVQTKHLLTICWPAVLKLEQFAPEEAAQKKQLLREIFLQFAISNCASIRRDADRLGVVPDRESFDERAEREDRELTKLMRFSETETLDKEAMLERVLNVSEQMAANRQWSYAADFLDLALRAFDLSPEVIQKQIDDLLIKGALTLTEDMSQFNEVQIRERRGHEIATSNSRDLTSILLAPGKSEAAYRQIISIEHNRILEYETQQLTTAVGEEKDKYIESIFDRLVLLEPSEARRFANPEAVDSYIDLLCRESSSHLSDHVTDSFVTQTIRLRNLGMLEAEQQNQILLTMADNLLNRIIDGPRLGDDFSRLIGYMSPILRATKAAETSDQEILWKFLPKQRVEAAFDAMIEAEAGAEWLEEEKQAFLGDVRQAWNDYWDRRQEY